MRPIYATLLLPLALAACGPQKTQNDIQRQQESQITTQGVQAVGMPAIANFREMRELKTIYEMRDQNNLSTWTYLFAQNTGKYILLCESVGYPIPYSAQFTAPTTMQTYNLAGQTGAGQAYYGSEDLPQADPNGLYTPDSAAGTWVLCLGPDKQTHPVYAEPDVITLTYALPDVPPAQP